VTMITITTAAPADPATITEYGDALPELVRALNHVTRHHGALDHPSDADRLIRNISRAVSMLPQLLEQVAGWLEAEQAAGRIEMAYGSPYPSPALADDVARRQLELAQAQARMLQQALDAAAAVTCDMSGVEDGSDEGSADEPGTA
jgi:hypothetical protein